MILLKSVQFFFYETEFDVPQDALELTKLELSMCPRVTLNLNLLHPFSVCWDYRCVPPQPVCVPLELKYRVSYLLDKSSIHWATSPVPAFLIPRPGASQ